MVDALITNSSVFWEKAQVQHFPTLRESPDQRFDVAIVGGGWIGIWAAYTLGQNGKKVILLEKDLLGREASGHSGGILLDALEGNDIAWVHDKYGKEIARALLLFSWEGTQLLPQENLEEESGYKNLGAIATFRSNYERDQYLAARSVMRALLPEIYKGQDFEPLTPHQTGSRLFFAGGGMYTPHGGVINPAATMRAFIKRFHDMRGNVGVYEKTEISDFEASEKGGVRLFVGGRGNLAINAQQVIFAGGGTYNLFDVYKDFPKLLPILSMMLATENPLPESARKRMANKKNEQIPLFGEGVRSPYLRFDEVGRLLFGASARAGRNEYPFMVRDVLATLFAMFPRARSMISNAGYKMWGRMEHYATDGLPFAVGFDPHHDRFIKTWHAHDVTTLPIIGIFGLGGQGNSMGPMLGKTVAQAILGNQDAYARLRMFHQIAPDKPLNLRRAQTRIARDPLRNDIT